MKSHSHYVIANLIMTTASILLLIFLFIYPGIYLRNMAEQVRTLAIDSILAIQKEDFESAQTHVESMTDIYDRYSEPLKLFLNHQDVDELSASIHGTYQLVLAEDNAQVLLELESIKKQVDFMESIESFSIYNLF